MAPCRSNSAKIDMLKNKVASVKCVAWLVSGRFAKDGFYPEMVEAQAKLSGKMAQGMKDTPM